MSCRASRRAMGDGVITGAAWNSMVLSSSATMTIENGRPTSMRRWILAFEWVRETLAEGGELRPSERPTAAEDD